MPIGNHMKKIIICILVLFLSCSNKSCTDLMPRSSLIKSANKSSNEKINDLKKRISSLEADSGSIEKNKSLLGDLYNNLGNKYLDGSEWDSAIEAFNNSLKYRRLNQITLYSLGLAFGNKGKISGNSDDLKKARFYYEKSLEIEPDYSSSAYALSVLLFFELDEKEKAVKILENITAKKKSFYIAHFALGRFYYELGELKKSLNVYESLCSELEKQPDSEIIINYRKQCSDNSSRIRSEQ
jgi:tetratricopeptide (TPR) repeat protein